MLANVDFDVRFAVVVTGAHLPEQYVSGPSLGIICDLGRPNSDELLGMRFVLDSIGDIALGTGIGRDWRGRVAVLLWGQA